MKNNATKDSRSRTRVTGKKEIVFNWSSPFTIFGLITVPRSKWTTIEQHFKLSVVKLMFKIYHDLTPRDTSLHVDDHYRQAEEQALTEWSKYPKRAAFYEAIYCLPRCHTGETLWNAIAQRDQEITNATELSSFVREVSKTNTFQDFNFTEHLLSTNNQQ